MAKKTTKKKRIPRTINKQDQEIMDFGRDLSLAIMLRSLCKTMDEFYKMLASISELAELEASHEAFLKSKNAP